MDKKETLRDATYDLIMTVDLDEEEEESDCDRPTNAKQCCEVCHERKYEYNGDIAKVPSRNRKNYLHECCGVKCTDVKTCINPHLAERLHPKLWKIAKEMVKEKKAAQKEEMDALKEKKRGKQRKEKQLV